MSRNRYEIEHWCDKKQETLIYLIVFGQLYFCKHCKMPLNEACDFKNNPYYEKGGHQQRSLANQPNHSKHH